MSVNLETTIQNMYNLKNRGITYSMNGSRTGADGTGDCSGTLYDSLRKGGATNAGWVLNTDSMHDWIVKNGFKLIAHNQSWNMKRGDIVIFGTKGASGGAAGHVVIAVDSINIIDCAWYGSSSVPAVRVRPETQLPYNMGWYVYRLQGGSSGGGGGSSQGNWISEKATFTLNTTINLRESVPNGKIIAVLNAGNSIKYDAYMITSDRMVWIRQPRANGKYGYMATGYQGGQRWGTFK